MTQACAIFFALVACSGCAVHKPQTYRLVEQGTVPVLLPPGVVAPDLAQRKFTADIGVGRAPCAPASGVVEMRVSKRRAVITVKRDTLLKQPSGWLSNWTAGLESQGCLAPGDGLKLAERIAESLPLDPKSAFRLLYASQADIGPRIRLQVVSPILREGAPTDAPLLDTVATTGSGASLTVVVKSTANLIGYETAWYSVQPKADGIGFTIAPLYAERHIGAEPERRPQSVTNYFQFPADAAFYRLFFKAEQSEFTALVIAARTPAELEQRFKVLEAGPASCAKLNGELCATIPKLVAVNPFLAVTVNGSELPVRLGATVGEAIRTAGERQPNAVLPQLAVFKPYNGRPAAVEFDRAGPAILNMILTGGEVLSWK